MKKTLLLAGVASLLAFQANAVEFKPYVGLDYAYTDVSATDQIYGVSDDYYETKFNSGVINAGTKVGDYFGIEAFYQKSGDEKGKHVTVVDAYDRTVAEGKIKTNFDAYGLDLMGYIPVTDKLEAIASVGAGQYEFEIEGLGYAFNEDGLGVRGGLGLQYNINDNLAVRGMARYVYLDMDEVDYLTEFTAGVRYSF
ncbi:MAG: porin family protein [Alphaproteobacteria bacterium]|nr:porin family protein [Alphaproteobacteria bacterium]